jgi:hypothetical protein
LEVRPCNLDDDSCSFRANYRRLDGICIRGLLHGLVFIGCYLIPRLMSRIQQDLYIVYDELYYPCWRLAEVILEVEWEIVWSVKIVLNISRELVLNIFFTQVWYPFQVVVLVALIPNLV